MAESLIAWVAPVPSQVRRGVEDALATINANSRSNALLPFEQLPMVHFASLTVFDFVGDGPPLLAFESNIDGSTEEYVTRLVEVGQAGLDELFQGDPAYLELRAAGQSPAQYLIDTCKHPQLFHIGHPNLSVEEIRGDHELRRSIKMEIDHGQRPSTIPGHPPTAVRDLSPREILAHIRGIIEPQIRKPRALWPVYRPYLPAWPVPPHHPVPLNAIQWQLRGWPKGFLLPQLKLLAIGCVVQIAAILLAGHYLGAPKIDPCVILSAVVAVLVARSAPDAKWLRAAFSAALVGGISYWSAAAVERFLGVHWLVLVVCWVFTIPAAIIAGTYIIIFASLKVTRPLPTLDAAERRRIHGLLEAEDRPEHSIYNHVAGLTIIESRYRWLRRQRTRLALIFLNLFYRAYFVTGRLASIPSIHFAQWNLIDDRRLLFLTNYDGSADSYLDDFFNGLADGVAFIWHDTRRFPGTSDPRALKLWVRQNQTLASARYRAEDTYAGLTVETVRNNQFIRSHLLSVNRRIGARRWLRRFSTTPVEPSWPSRLQDRLRELAQPAE